MTLQLRWLHTFTTAATILLTAIFVLPTAQADIAPAVRTTLPQDHEYQKVLRSFMATLTEKDFDHGVTTNMTHAASSDDPDYLYRNYIYTLSPQPLVGSKRGTPAITTPAANYTLAKIENPQGHFATYGWAEATISLVQWDYPGNPYRDNRALKLRSFVGGAVNLIMVDELLDRSPNLVRTDRIPNYLVRTGAAYPAFKSLLPSEVQKAYQEGVRTLAERILALPPKGEEANLDMTAPVGLSYAARVLEDEKFTKRVEEYSRQYFADPKRFNPAGYWVERGGLDINYSGTTNYFAVWAALMNDWPFANDAVTKVYRLRAHLLLPDPNGRFIGPSHFNNRTGGDAMKDQWDYDNRDRGAAMITDEAAFLTPVPTPEQLAKGGASRASEYARQIHENPGFVANDKLTNFAWGYSLFANFNFPASVNPAFEFYKKGSLERLQSLAAKSPAMMKSPYLRDENFTREFGTAFVAARRPTFAAIIHTGPVGAQKAGEGDLFQYSGPLGYGGGQLSAFWTPTAGSVLLGRRSGQSWHKTFEDPKAWRNLPIHAVTGVTSSGTVFTSARITQPKVEGKADSSSGLTVSGALVALKPVPFTEVDNNGRDIARDLMYDGPLGGVIDYARTFKLDDKGVSVQTALKGDGKDEIAELYETIPVCVSDGATVNYKPADDSTFAVEFLVGANFVPATPDYTADVKAVKITRYGGAVTVTFDKPRRAKLSPDEFKDAYVSRMTSRAVLVDLLESGDKSTVLKGEKKIAYRVEAAAK